MQLKELLIVAFLVLVVSKEIVKSNRRVYEDDMLHYLKDFSSNNEFSDAQKALSQFVHAESAKIKHRSDLKLNRRAPLSYQHTAVIAIAQKNIELVKQILDDVSNPFSPNYGQYKSFNEVGELTSNIEARVHVEKYLKRHKIEVLSQTTFGEYITVRAPISKWEEILNTEFFEFDLSAKSVDGMNLQTKIHRCLNYSLSRYLRDHVRAVFNTVQFPDSFELQAVQQHKITPLEAKHIADKFAGFTTPELINTIYDIRNNKGSLMASQGLYEALGQYFSPTDLLNFQSLFGLPLEPVASSIGSHKSDLRCYESLGKDCAEANLDVQYIMAVAQNVSTTYYYWSGEDFLLDWVKKVANVKKPPNVFSISYGMDEMGLADSYFASFEIEAMKLSLRGVTLVAASGDDGAVTGTAKKSSDHCRYAPGFPASSAYVTAVGATMGPEKGLAEIGCSSDRGGLITSGGGFSGSNPMPSWQAAAVETYFDHVTGTDKEPFHGFNRHGRGYPDVSALGHNYVVAIAGNFTAVSGTSASSPVFAGIISLVNSARLAVGKSTVGWINPALYMTAEKFVFDITEGANHCVSAESVCCNQGFYAVPGWDPVTGLGSVNVTALIETFMTFGNHLPTPTKPPSSPSLHTPKPTPAPTMAPGWMTVTGYADEGCSGEVTDVAGTVTGVCLIEYDGSLAVGSRKYICDDVYVTVEYYSDTKCSPSKTLGIDLYGQGCSRRVENYYYSHNFFSKNLQCSSTLDVASRLPKLTNPYVAHMSYDGNCDANVLSSIHAIKQNHCFDVPTKQKSYMFVYPNYMIYSQPLCEGTVSETVELNTECALISSDTGGGTYSYGYGGESYSYQDDGGGYYSYGSYAYTNKAATSKTAEGYYGGGGYYYPDLGDIAKYDLWQLMEGKAVNSVVSGATSLTPTPMPSLQPRKTVAATNQPSNVPSIYVINGPTSVNVPTGPDETQLPSLPPTDAPSLVPSESQTIHTYPTTPAPTESPIYLKAFTFAEFLVHQIFNGVSAKQFSEDVELSRQVLSLAVAATLKKIQPENVKIVSVQDIEMNAQQERVQDRALQETILACNVSYVIGFETDDFTASQTLLRVYSLELQAAVLSGEFDDAMQRIARRLHSIPLRNIVTVNVNVAPSLTYSFTGTSTTSKDPIPKSSFYAKLLAASLILFFIGVAVLFFRKSIQTVAQSLYLQLTSSYSEVPLSSDSQHPGNAELDGDIHNPVHSNGSSPDDDSAVEMTDMKSAILNNGAYSKV